MRRSSSTDETGLSSEGNSDALSQLTMAENPETETDKEDIGYDFDRPEVSDSDSEVMPLDMNEQSGETSQKADEGTENSSENFTENNDETSTLADDTDVNEQLGDTGAENVPTQQKSMTKEDLLQALITYRNNLQRMVGARGVLNSINVDLVNFQQKDTAYSSSIESVVDGVISAATTLRDFFDSYNTMLSNTELEELKEYISSSLNDAGYRYHSKVSELYESGLDAITSHKRKAKQVERDANALYKQLAEGSSSDDDTTEKMTQIKGVIQLEQQELTALKNVTKKFLNNLASYKTKMDSASSVDKLKSLISKSKQLVQTHIEYLQKLKEKFVETEGDNSQKLKDIVDGISSKASSVYTAAKGVYKNSKSTYKDIKHTLAGN